MIDGLKKMMGLFTSGLESKIRPKEPEKGFILDPGKECYFEDPDLPRLNWRPERKKYKENSFEEL